MTKGYYKFIHELTKELRLNNGEGFTVNYIKQVLSETNPRKNEDIEIIAAVLKNATKQTKKIITQSFVELKEEKTFWLKLNSKLNKSAA